MTDRFNSMQLFISVGQSGSLSAAANEFGVAQATVSRLMTALEAQVGAQLLLRSTRAVTLTDAGVRYLVQCEQILEAYDEAVNVTRTSGELQGVLRVAATPSFAARTLMPRMYRFCDAHPNLQMDFVIEEARRSIIGDDFDVAVYVGDRKIDGAYVKKIGTVRRVLVAAPRYISRLGMPNHPSDLGEHACILVSNEKRHSETWTFQKVGRNASVRVQGRFQIDSAEAAISAATAGLGVLAVSDEDVQSELQAGELIQILPDWEFDRDDVCVFLPTGSRVKASARAFASFITTQIGAPLDHTLPRRVRGLRIGSEVLAR